MKPLARKFLVGAALAAMQALSLAGASAQTESEVAPEVTPPPLGVATPTPPTAKPNDPAKGKKGKATRNPNDPAPTPKQRKRQDIPFPVPIGRSALKVRVPSYDAMGKLLSMIDSAKMTHIDNEHVQMDGMKFDMNEANGKDEYHVEMPTCILDLKTNIITSDHPVVIRTKDFELTGDKVQFNTVEQSGALQGNVHMVIHNLKQVATPGQPVPES